MDRNHVNFERLCMRGNDKKRVWAGATLLALAGLLAPVASAAELPPAEKLLDKYAEAIGGKALGNVKNMSADFEFSMPMQGVYTSGVEYWEKPGRHYIRIDLTSSGVPNYEAGVLDGVAWESHPMNGTRKLEGVEARERLRQASLNPFASWQQEFEKAETVAEETVGEQACYKVEFTPAEGPALHAYFDKDSGLLVRQELMGPSGPAVTVDLLDYEEVQGIRSPRLLEQKGPQSYSIQYTRVAYDVDEIPSDTFDLPPALAAPEQPAAR
jgi:hypothetical protein